MMQYQELINHVYQAFNARDIDSVFELLHSDVDWPNGWEGGYVKGHDDVRNYWLRQWGEVNPIVTPVSIVQKNDGRIEVDVHQVVKDLHGNVLSDDLIKHLYTLDNGKISRMDIEKH